MEKTQVMPKLPKPKRLSYVPEYQAPPRKATSDQGFYNSPAWRKLRRMVMQKRPWCEAHKQTGQLIDITFGGHCDHIIAISQGGARSDERNLMMLCKDCHDRKSALEGHHGVLCDTEPGEGGLIPAQGGKELILEKLAKYLCE